MQGFIGSMLRDTVSWEKRTAEDSWEGSTYAPPRSIPAFKVAKTREVAGPGGLEIHQIWQVAVTEEVSVGDKLDGHTVQGVETIRGLDTDTLGYIASTD